VKNRNYFDVVFLVDEKEKHLQIIEDVDDVKKVKIKMFLNE
jgi:hypothetical protein